MVFPSSTAYRRRYCVAYSTCCTSCACFEVAHVRMCAALCLQASTANDASSLLPSAPLALQQLPFSSFQVWLTRRLLSLLAASLAKGSALRLAARAMGHAVSIVSNIDCVILSEVAAVLACGDCLHGVARCPAC